VAPEQSAGVDDGGVALPLLERFSPQPERGWVKIGPGLWAKDEQTAQQARAAAGVDRGATWSDLVLNSFELDAVDSQREGARAQRDQASLDMMDATGKLDSARPQLKDARRAYENAQEDLANAVFRAREARDAFDRARDAALACRIGWQNACQAALAD
jgi:hypothetical protein